MVGHKEVAPGWNTGRGAVLDCLAAGHQRLGCRSGVGVGGGHGSEVAPGWSTGLGAVPGGPAAGRRSGAGMVFAERPGPLPRDKLKQRMY